MKHLNTPGQALLSTFQRAMSPEQRPAFDGFVRRNLDALSARLDQWILDDSLKQSRRALPDTVLFGADVQARETLLLPLLGNYWAMDALVRRGAERGAGSREMVTKLLEHYALREKRTRDEDAAIAAATGTPWEGWAPPVYSRASPVDIKTAKGRATLARRLVAALARLPARSIPALHREVGGTPQQVRATLKRLTSEGTVWSYTLQGYKKYDEAQAVGSDRRKDGAAARSVRRARARYAEAQGQEDEGTTPGARRRDEGPVVAAVRARARQRRLVRGGT